MAFRRAGVLPSARCCAAMSSSPARRCCVKSAPLVPLRRCVGRDHFCARRLPGRGPRGVTSGRLRVSDGSVPTSFCSWARVDSEAFVARPVSRRVLVSRREHRLLAIFFARSRPIGRAFATRRLRIPRTSCCPTGACVAGSRSLERSIAIRSRRQVVQLRVSLRSRSRYCSLEPAGDLVPFRGDDASPFSSNCAIARSRLRPAIGSSAARVRLVLLQDAAGFG